MPWQQKIVKISAKSKKNCKPAENLHFPTFIPSLLRLSPWSLSSREGHFFLMLFFFKDCLLSNQRKRLVMKDRSKSPFSGLIYDLEKS